MKYDLTLCVLACAKKEKYINRLKEFVNVYGIKHNNKKINLKVVYLVEDEEKPDFISNDSIWFNCPNSPLSLRWLLFLKHTNIDTKWIMQVDDDSSTDVDKTVEILNQFYDYEDPMLLMGGRNADLESSQQKILKDLKIDNIFCGKDTINEYDAVPHFIHAWEPSIISKAGQTKFKAWKKLDWYIKECKKVKPTFGDQTPYVVAKIVKVPICETSFLCPFEQGYQYSGINKNGQFSHIHYVTDKWKSFNKFKEALQNNKVFQNDKDAKAFLEPDIATDPNVFENTSWKFYGNGRFYGIIVLGSNGSIHNYNNDNEKYWKFENNILSLLDKNKKITTNLNRATDNKFEGKFLGDAKVIHVLERA